MNNIGNKTTQKRRPLVGMATKQVMPPHFFNNLAKGGSPVYKDLHICYCKIILPSLFLLKQIGSMNNH